MPLSPASKELDSSTSLPSFSNAFGATIRGPQVTKATSERLRITRDAEPSGSAFSFPEAPGGLQTVEGQKSIPLRPLLPIIGTKHTSHLLTPQSPNNIGAYSDSPTFGLESSPHKGRHSLFRSPSEERTHTPPNERTKPHTSLMTPESSPIFARGSRTSHSPSGSSPPSTPPRIRSPATPERPSFAMPHSPVRSMSTPHTINSSPHSGLSSPFVEASERRRLTKSTPRHSAISSPTLPDEGAFSPPSSLAVTPPPLSAPIPQRVIPSEIQRIRLQMAADQAARLEEAEARRPDYLKRTKRPPSNSAPDVAADDQENTYPGLGVVDSPSKGRRLALFQETSEESFEQSLLAGGYPLYGHTAAYTEPSTPARNGKMSRERGSEHTMDIPSEKELKKQWRLAAFRDHNRSDSHTQLYPVTLEGIGRVLLDRLPPEPPSQSDSPHRKKGSRKRKGSTLESPAAKRMLGSPVKRPSELPQEGESTRPNWPDQAFPWSLRSQQRAEYVKREEEERLRWIERYLDRDSDEDEDSEDQSLGLPRIEEEITPVRRGRGKMVPLRLNHHEPNHPVKRMLIPSDPADARAALLSKRSVRALAYRRRLEENQEVCICHGKHDGRELVQCDECHKWFHLECIGIDDITELGKEEDPWYCDQCLGVDKPAPSSPTFVPTDDRLPSNKRRDLVFFPGSVQESPPAIPWNTPSRVPKTPQGSDLTRTFSTRSSMGDSSQFGPETPSNTAHSVRVYSTPGPTSFLESLDEPFDPNATPSRGMKFSGPFTTPKAPSLWGYRGGFSQTPSRSSHKSYGGSFPFAFESGNASSRNVYQNDESPVRRSTKPSATLCPPDSPLARRGTIFPVFGTQQSSVSRTNSIEKLHT